MTAQLKKYFQLSFTAKILILLQLFFIIRFHFRDGLEKQSIDPTNLAIILLGIIFIHSFQKIFAILTYKNRFFNILTNLLLIIISASLGIYHLRSGRGLDFGMISANSSLIFYQDSWKVFLDIPRTKDLWQLAILIVSVLFSEFKWKKLSYSKNKTLSYLQLPLSLVICITIITTTPYLYGSFPSLFGTAYRHYFPPTPLLPALDTQKRFPYKKTVKPLLTASLPHIFILFVESFNANFVRKKNSAGQEFTPFFNSLIEQGVFFENFYGASIQTTKGQFATLCSLLPLVHGKAFLQAMKINFNCLPKMLKTNGYQTIFTQAYADLNFDNTKSFSTKIGFEKLISMSDKFITTAERKKYTWGWGIQDSIYYKKVFSYLDQKYKKEPKGPLFVTLATISNHMKFKHTPVNQRYLYPKQKNRRQRYANTLRATDEYLKTFISELHKREYLKNSIVYILGDHSFPVGEHGNYSSENGHYNENFKTPLLILGTKKKPHVVKTIHSQLDIAPTIISRLGIFPNHFQGVDLFRNHSIGALCVQPYAGTYLAYISPENFKYVYHERTTSEFVYNLTKDPKERENIINTVSTDTLQKFRSQAAKFYLNDSLIKNNRIWPE